MKNFTRFLLIAALVVLWQNSVFAQGTTTSSMNGRILDSKGEALTGATIQAVDNSVGTQFGTVTDANGYYHLPNLNVGGPYTITFSFVGFEPLITNDVYLTLGQTMRLNGKLSESAYQIGEVGVTAERNDVFDGNRTGSETNVSNRTIETIPSIGRGISDFTRLTPQAKINSSGGIEIAGSNNRYNSIYIDGAVNNDVFGLTSTGTNGGQTGISPFSMDIIDQISIQVAPYDIKLGGFTGAGINAVTRRGKNIVEGSAYYYTRNESFAGKTPTDDETLERKELNPFNSNTYGFRLGGPIIKNKLFFFVNAEIQKEETPQPFDFSTYKGAVTQADMASLITKLEEMGYAPGSYTDVNRTLDGAKFFARLDWDINSVHKLMIRHQYTKADQYSPSNSNSTAIRFANSGVYFPSTTNTSAIELKSNLSNSMSNSLIVGYTTVNDDRNPMGANFPYVQIKDGTSNIYFGSEQYSTANKLTQKIVTLTDNFELYKGKHKFTFGTHNEFYDIYNLFVRQNFGSYQFSSFSTFMNNQPAYQYDRTFSAVDDITGDGSKAAAEFKALQIGVYAQDEIQLSEKLKITAGLRLDVPMFLDQPLENKDFNENVIPLLEDAGWDLEGAKTGQVPAPSLMFNPRVGFNYDVTGNKDFQIRGGAGIFTSRIPFVWPGASFQNNAVMTGGMQIKTAGSPELVFNSDWENQPSLPPTQPSGQVDIFAKNFKFPQVFRSSLAVDKKLPWGMVATVEFIYTKTLNNVIYYNLRYKKDANLTGTGDTRQTWTQIPLGTDPTTGKNRAYTDIVFGTNTDQGYTYNFTAQLQKSFSKGFMASVAYNYGRAMSMNDGLSSQNSSQLRVPNVNGYNAIELGYSSFDMGHRIVGFASYKLEWLEAMATTFSLFYNGQSGDRFSYGYSDGSSAYLGEDKQSLELMYVPTDENDINLKDIKNTAGEVTLSAAQQWTDLNEFIENDEYLSTRRGQYVEPNSSRAPFVNTFDFRISHEFFDVVKGKRNSLQVSFDIFNIGNMLNKDWGRIYYAPAYYNNYALMKFEGFVTGTKEPIFSFTKPKGGTIFSIDDSGLQSSRWQAQITLRYNFN